jgi:hypothetical protein
VPPSPTFWQQQVAHSEIAQAPGILIILTLIVLWCADVISAAVLIAFIVINLLLAILLQPVRIADK